MTPWRTRTLLLPLLGACLFPAAAGTKLPEGPPWRTDYKAARREALRAGKPLFLFFTKTY